MEISVVAQVLQESTDQYDQSLTSIQQCLRAYEKHISGLIERIALAKSISDVAAEFDELIAIQSQLAPLVFGRRIEVGERLEILIREFDRLYDPYIQQYWFEKFSCGLDWPTKPT